MKFSYKQLSISVFLPFHDLSHFSYTNCYVFPLHFIFSYFQPCGVFFDRLLSTFTVYWVMEDFLNGLLDFTLLLWLVRWS